MTDPSRREVCASVMNKIGYAKIRWTRREALRDGYPYAWIDTCCIDKDSSTELSTAINSMYDWYRSSSKCCAYLADVKVSNERNRVSKSFTQSRWFSRGWTLQELIAPSNVAFYEAEWKFLGDRNHELLEAISIRTGIDQEALLQPEQIHQRSVAAKMSWAAERETT